MMLVAYIYYNEHHVQNLQLAACTCLQTFPTVNHMVSKHAHKN
jgi:hypothetical protein